MSKSFGTTVPRKLALVGMLFLAMMFCRVEFAAAEYGDIVINNYSDGAGMRPVIFPHWFHRVRFACKVCHADLGFALKAGGDQMDMAKILDGQFCGACHNGTTAWATERCALCHSGRTGMPSQVNKNGDPKLTEVAPAPAKK
jgi:c(7)-type cytochrome triheme protein